MKFDSAISVYLSLSTVQASLYLTVFYAHFMKQSTKLLSLLLALIMAFSCMSVIGNAALVRNEIAYDSLDDSMQMSKNMHQIYTTFPIEKGNSYMYNKVC